MPLSHASVRYEGERPSPYPRCTTRRLCSSNRERRPGLPSTPPREKGALRANRDTFREQGPFTCSRRDSPPPREEEAIRGARDRRTFRWADRQVMLVTPPRNLDSHRGKCSPRGERPDVSSPDISPWIAPGKRVLLGHRSHAPATFFEVRFASLFEARRRLFVSAITRLTGETRSNPQIPAGREPRLSSVHRADLPCGRVRRACRRRAFDPADPAPVFPSSSPHRLSPA